MNCVMDYRGYVGSVEFSQEDELFYGKVLGIRSLISYEGTDVKSLVGDFHEAVDEYLLICEKNGKEPETAYKGSLNIRIDPALHKEAALRALAYSQSLNKFIGDAIREKLQRTDG